MSFGTCPTCQSELVATSDQFAICPACNGRLVPRHDYHANRVAEHNRRVIAELNRKAGLGSDTIRIIGGSHPFQKHERQTCSCGAREGELHALSCMREICPFCLVRVNNISCECISQIAERMGLDPDSEADLEVAVVEYDRMIEEKGRLPFVEQPHVCARCGEVWPIYFDADDWDEFIPPPLRDELLCLDCYLAIKGWVIAARNLKCSTTDE